MRVQTALTNAKYKTYSFDIFMLNIICILYTYILYSKYIKYLTYRFNCDSALELGARRFLELVLQFHMSRNIDNNLDNKE